MLYYSYKIGFLKEKHNGKYVWRIFKATATGKEFNAKRFGGIIIRIGIRREQMGEKREKY